MLAFAARRPTEPEAEGLTGAAAGERSPDRTPRCGVTAASAAGIASSRPKPTPRFRPGTRLTDGVTGVARGGSMASVSSHRSVARPEASASKAATTPHHLGEARP